jgi:hypothetical protein
VIPQVAGALLALTAAAEAGTLTKGLVPLAPKNVYVAPMPVPLAPPTSLGPAVVPPGGLSPLLSQPSAIFRTPERAGPSYPASPVPAPIDQQKIQSYRNDLINRRFRLDRQGISPDDERYREIQQQLNQLGVR